MTVQSGIRRGLRWPPTRIGRPLVDRMWQLRSSITAHIAAYVAAAEALGCPLVTADGRLAKAHGVRCEISLISPS